MGVVAAILPTTNPTSTAIYKIAHLAQSRQRHRASARIRARMRAPATPPTCCIAPRWKPARPRISSSAWTTPRIEGTNALMRHERTGVILSTGGHGIVSAAYSSGKPAFGVGPGNVPVLVDTLGRPRRRHRQNRRRQVVRLRHGLLQRAGHRGRRLAARPHPGLLKAQQGYFCTRAAEATRSASCWSRRTGPSIPHCVGQAPTKIAAHGGLRSARRTPPSSAGEVDGVGKQHPLSVEKLSPVLSLYFVPDFAAGMNSATACCDSAGWATLRHLFEGRRAHPRIRRCACRPIACW